MSRRGPPSSASVPGREGEESIRTLGAPRAGGSARLPGREAAAAVAARAGIDGAAGLAAADEDVVERGALERLEAAEDVLAVPDREAAAQRGVDAGRADLLAGPLLAGGRREEGADISRARAADHAVPAVVAVDEVLGARPAVDAVDAEAAGDVVAVAGAAEDAVVAEVAVNEVPVPIPAIDEVVAAAALEDVGVRPRRTAGRCRCPR